MDDPRWTDAVNALAADPALQEAVGMATLWGSHGLDMTYVMALPHLQRNAIAQVMMTFMQQRKDAIDAEIKRIGSRY